MTNALYLSNQTSHDVNRLDAILSADALFSIQRVEQMNGVDVVQITMQEQA